MQDLHIRSSASQIKKALAQNRSIQISKLFTFILLSNVQHLREAQKLIKDNLVSKINLLFLWIDCLETLQPQCLKENQQLR